MRALLRLRGPRSPRRLPSCAGWSSTEAST